MWLTSTICADHYLFSLWCSGTQNRITFYEYFYVTTLPIYSYKLDDFMYPHWNVSSPSIIQVYCKLHVNLIVLGYQFSSISHTAHCWPPAIHISVMWAYCVCVCVCVCVCSIFWQNKTDSWSSLSLDDSLPLFGLLRWLARKEKVRWLCHLLRSYNCPSTKNTPRN